MIERLEATLALIAQPAVGALIADSRPGFVLDATGTAIVFANAAGAGLAGVRTLDALEGRPLPLDDKLRRHVAQFAATAAPGRQSHELVRYFKGLKPVTLPLHCQAIATADGGVHIVVRAPASGESAGDAGLQALLDLFAGPDRLAAAFDGQGEIIGAAGDHNILIEPHDEAAQIEVETLVDRCADGGPQHLRMAIAGFYRSVGAVAIGSNGQAARLLLVGPAEAAVTEEPARIPAAAAPEVLDQERAESAEAHRDAAPAATAAAALAAAAPVASELGHAEPATADATVEEPAARMAAADAMVAVEAPVAEDRAAEAAVGERADMADDSEAAVAGPTPAHEPAHIELIAMGAFVTEAAESATVSDTQTAAIVEPLALLPALAADPAVTETQLEQAIAIVTGTETMLAGADRLSLSASAPMADEAAHEPAITVPAQPVVAHQASVPASDADATAAREPEPAAEPDAQSPADIAPAAAGAAAEQAATFAAPAQPRSGALAQDASAPGEPAAEAASSFVFDRDGRPRKFVWLMDAGQRFTFVSDELGAVVGPTSAGLVGENWREVAERLDIDRDGRIAAALDRRDTWSGSTVLWPVDGAPLRVPVDLAALPAFGRARSFEGFRGFGICRTPDAVAEPKPTATAIDRTEAGEPAGHLVEAQAFATEPLADAPGTDAAPGAVAVATIASEAAEAVAQGAVAEAGVAPPAASAHADGCEADAVAFEAAAPLLAPVADPAAHAPAAIEPSVVTPEIAGLEAPEWPVSNQQAPAPQSPEPTPTADIAAEPAADQSASTALVDAEELAPAKPAIATEVQPPAAPLAAVAPEHPTEPADRPAAAETTLEETAVHANDAATLADDVRAAAIEPDGKSDTETGERVVERELVESPTVAADTEREPVEALASAEKPAAASTEREPAEADARAETLAAAPVPAARPSLHALLAAAMAAAKPSAIEPAVQPSEIEPPTAIEPTAASHEPAELALAHDIAMAASAADVITATEAIPDALPDDSVAPQMAAEPAPAVETMPAAIAETNLAAIAATEPATIGVTDATPASATEVASSSSVVPTATVLAETAATVTTLVESAVAEATAPTAANAPSHPAAPTAADVASPLAPLTVGAETAPVVVEPAVVPAPVSAAKAASPAPAAPAFESPASPSATAPAKPADGKIAAMAAATRIVPEATRLSGPERVAFRQIAEALGARLDGDADRSPRATSRSAAPAPAVTAPARPSAVKSDAAGAAAAAPRVDAKPAETAAPVVESLAPTAPEASPAAIVPSVAAGVVAPSLPVLPTAEVPAAHAPVQEITALAIEPAAADKLVATPDVTQTLEATAGHVATSAMEAELAFVQAAAPALEADATAEFTPAPTGLETLVAPEMPFAAVLAPEPAKTEAVGVAPGAAGPSEWVSDGPRTVATEVHALAPPATEPVESIPEAPQVVVTEPHGLAAPMAEPAAPVTDAPLHRAFHTEAGERAAEASESAAAAVEAHAVAEAEAVSAASVAPSPSFGEPESADSGRRSGDFSGLLGSEADHVPAIIIAPPQPVGPVVSLVSSREIEPIVMASPASAAVSARPGPASVEPSPSAAPVSAAHSPQPSSLAATAGEPTDRPAPGGHTAAPLVAAEAAATSSAERAAAPVPALANGTIALDRRMLDRLPVAIAILKDQEVVHANSSFLALLGYADLADLAKAGGLDALFAGPHAARSTGEDQGRAVPAIAKDGSVVPVDARLMTTPWNGSTALLLTLEKVTLPAAAPAAPMVDRATGEALAAAQTRLEELEAIVDTATDGVLMLDAGGTVMTANRAAEALFGMDRAAMAGRPLVDLLAPESRRSAMDYLDGLARNGVASVLNDGREVIGQVRQGGLIPLFITIGRLSSGEDRKFCAVLRDITQWKKSEEELTAQRRRAEEASVHKSEFLAKISHEIRTPLNAIIGFSEVMMDERFGSVGNERYKDYLRDIHSSGTHIMSLINDLLDLSKVEAGKMELKFEAVGLADIMAECVAMMQPQANRERIIIRTSLPATVPNVVADLRSIRQIVLNLLSNAVKFTPAGGQVIVSTALEDTGEVVMRVRDTGYGMTEKEIQTALEPFRQLHTTRVRSGGTGLGLPLTKALVEANRAGFRIDSAVNQGTLVQITFPTTRVLAS